VVAIAQAIAEQQLLSKKKLNNKVKETSPSILVKI
jgi:hypothetical protein